MKTLTKHLQELKKLEIENKNDFDFKRRQELSGIKKSKHLGRYAIRVTYETDNNLLLEHEEYKQFKKSNNLWRVDAANANIPVQKHYHIVDRKGKKDIYAVNLDGTAHHRENKGYEVPKKEADELRKMGVDIARDRILESIYIPLNEKYDSEYTTFLFIIN